LQAVEFARRLDAKIAADCLKLQNSLLISLLAGNLDLETGSQLTASSASQSRLRRQHVKTAENGAAPRHFADVA